jgi:secernin
MAVCIRKSPGIWLKFMVKDTRPYSCDTLVALKDTTRLKTTMLGKNSDRPVFDCQPLIYTPRRAKGGTLDLAYLGLPDTGSYATLGSSPYWCWGFEEGLNEWGVAIGNEAIFTRTWREQQASYLAGDFPAKGILGMELLRLGLERGRTAREALEIMTALLEEYGQWGSGVPGSPHETGGYDNSFIIADASEAWVLETVGKEWAAKRYGEGVTSISNQPSIRNDWSLASDNLVDYATARGWWREDKRETFDFARAYIDLEKPLQLSHLRVCRSQALLKEKAGDVSLAWLWRILRDHYEDTFLAGPYFNAALPDFLTLCMHSSPANFTWGDTASSAVFVLPTSERLAQFWWAPVTPCTSVYVPFYIEAGGLPEIVSRAGVQGKSVTPPPEAARDSSAAHSYWWLFKDLLEATKGNATGDAFNERQPLVRARFDELEQAFMGEAPEMEALALEYRQQGQREKMARVLYDFSERCVKKAVSAAEELKAAFALEP